MSFTVAVLIRGVVLSLMTFSSFVVQGQKKSDQIFIGINFSPDYNFRTLKNNGNNSSSDIVIKNRNEIETSKFGYTTGLNIIFSSSRNVRLKTGIQYSNKGYKTKNQDLIFASPDPSMASKSKFIYSYEYIGIPLEAKFGWGQSKIRFLSSIGFMTNLLLKVNQTNVVEYSDGRTNERKQATTSGFKKLDITPTISFGIDYKVRERFHFIMEPTFRYGVLETIDAPVTEHLWNAGLNIGIYHSLK